METKTNHDEDLILTSILNFRILKFLDSRNGSAYYEDLKEYLGKSKSQISTALKKLVAKGLIRKDIRRPKTISITEKGLNIKNRTLIELMK